MPLPRAARQFDEISPEYDATRPPLDPETVAGIVRVLGEHGVRSVLEVGVGTGRVAGPLAAGGLRVTGVDAARGMLARARAKGLERLVRGSAYRPPFRPGAFDAALFVHVLHVLDDPPRAITVAGDVASGLVFGLVRPRSGTEGERSAGWSARRRVYEILSEEGYAVARDRPGGPGGRERELLATWPPDELVVIADRTVTEPIGRTLDLMARRASRHVLDVPPEALARAVDAVRREVGDRTFTFRRGEALAAWRPRAAAA